MRSVPIALALCFPLQVQAQEDLNPINPLPGVKTWRWSGSGVNVRLTQIIPEQVRGFYLGRGFTAEDAELIAGDCIFQTVVRNDSADATVRMDMRRWRVVSSRGEGRPKLREDWGDIWRQRNSPAAARLAFRWALFPSVQQYEPGDWNMGMSSYGLAPGEHFDLTVVFDVAGTQKTGNISGIQCAEDTMPQ